MERDFENVDNVDELSDDELKRLVRTELEEDERVDADSIVVTAHAGVVRLSGRVGTETERRIAERVVTDVLGISRFENELVVDEIRRDLAPEAADDEAAQSAELGHSLVQEQQDPEAAHLAHDVEREMYGTPDEHDAIERAEPWIPPERPTSEGTGEEAGFHDPQDDID
ncbi:MAG TPA: BON domain-containing protein [Gemmatimonadaceae bacterium]|nr:BON domain-containing protein [Gemmatimonadaceae bacterium]